jgi:hypothetical protein
MTKYAILHIHELKINKQGDTIYDQSVALEDILKTAKELCKENQNIQSIGGLAWIFPLQSALPHLSNVVDSLHKKDLSYRVAYFDNLEWLEFNKK